jgi:NlpC/P60 family putative phage cell wall peptidase
LVEVTPMPERSVIVEVARRWIGTPYHHQQAVRGAGCDCLGLVRGLWRELYGEEPETPPPYTPDWGEVGAAEPLLDAARRHMREVTLAKARAGDVLVFRLKPNAVAKHAAVLSAPARMIHAQSNDCVREIVLTDGWLRKAAAAFAFPGVF